jgi:hypothetical protein
MFITLPSPISELQHAPLPFKVLRAKERALTPCFFAIFSLDSHLNPLRSLGVRQSPFQPVLSLDFANYPCPITKLQIGLQIHLPIFLGPNTLHPPFLSSTLTCLFLPLWCQKIAIVAYNTLLLI